MAEFKKIINVIPLTSVDLISSQIFTYLLPDHYHDQTRIGQLVSISFGRRSVQGVIASHEAHRLSSEIKGLKEIDKILDMEPVLTDKALALASFTASYYVCALGLVVKSMLPRMAGGTRRIRKESNHILNPNFILNEHQNYAVTSIVSAIGKPQSFLLHGVTGSGKTEVYMQSIAKVLEKGMSAIVLVPEISLTPQAAERFGNRFGENQVAVLHSKLKTTERYLIWKKIRSSEKKIVIGPRSAVFAPVQALGIIIIDEDHDSSFKQFDQNPKYHAKTLAKKLSEIWSCPLVMGDATPQMETFHDAVTKKIIYLKLPFRIKADSTMPQVKVVDMRREQEKGNFGIFSDMLKNEILKNLQQKKQIILFLNRRGSAHLVICHHCGYVPSCTNCSANLVWHAQIGKLICHHCGKTYARLSSCPTCHKSEIRYLSFGTQGLGLELQTFLKAHFPSDRLPVVSRMDRDTTSKTGNLGKTYQAWVSGKIDILIGTKMIAKGWDVHNVGLVGILSADSMLYLPDFRSAERTFQILTQVSGRTGRGASTGAVILQTFNPENYAIAAVRTHDFQNFYNIEISHRRKHHYPPFSKLIKLIISGTNADQTYTKAKSVRKLLDEKNLHAEIYGPLPAFIYKLRGKFQFYIILKFPDTEHPDLYATLHDLPSYVHIDVDPDSLL